MSAARNSFSLKGPSITLDPRIHAVRGDLADATLAGQLFAPHYAEAMAMRCVVPFAALLYTPHGEQGSELLAGETFCVLDIAGGWAWGYCAHDHYVGYLKADALGPFVAPPPTPAGDPIAIAKSFLGKPYVWGGRGGAGIDCSGLIQRALAAIGVAAPRDSDMQQAALGTAIPEGAALQAQDLIFFPGHVGIMADAQTLVHATRHYGKTVTEPLVDVIARVAQEHEVPVLARKRLG
jgi:cell wall-associated NlpC family hydrolase